MLTTLPQRNLNQVNNAFSEKTGLCPAIEEKVLPAMVRIKTSNGIHGLAFHQHEQWLVSNAHIFRCQELVNRAECSFHDGTSLELKADAAYLRPNDTCTAPDLVIIKTTHSRPGLTPKELLPRASDDSGLRCFFYLMYCEGEFKVRYVTPVSAPGQYPLVYQGMPGECAMPGCSGGPVMAARFRLSRGEPLWDFYVHSVLYARCSANSVIHSTKSSLDLRPDDSLIYGISPAEDFHQLLPGILHDESAQRKHAMAKAHQTFRNARGQQDALRCMKEAEDEKIKSQQVFHEFSQGMTALNIELPQGLEKLFYNGLVTLDKSLLIKQVLKKECKKLGRKSDEVRIKLSELGALTDDLDVLFTTIANAKSIQFNRSEDSFFQSKNKLLRVDLDAKSSTHWILDIQDDTGRGKTLNGKSLSSVFAKVKIDRNHGAITGELLANAFHASYLNQKPVIIENFEIELEEDKQKTSKTKTKQKK